MSCLIFTKNMSSLTSFKKYYLTILLTPMNIDPSYTKIMLHTRINEYLHYLLF